MRGEGPRGAPPTPPMGLVKRPSSACFGAPRIKLVRRPSSAGFGAPRDASASPRACASQPCLHAKPGGAAGMPICFSSRRPPQTVPPELRTALEHVLEQAPLSLVAVSDSPGGGGAAGECAANKRHEACKTKKVVESDAKAIENRIHYFQREEEKLWRDLKEVRRQAAAVEEGRSRAFEKRLADRKRQEEHNLIVAKNRAMASTNKDIGFEKRRHTQFLAMRRKHVAGQLQRQASEDILRRKRVAEAEAQLHNSERAVAIQRAQLQAKLKVNEEKAARIAQLRQRQEADWQAAENELQEAESRLPQLEAEEIACLERLQMSHTFTKTIRQELESSLGSRG